MRKLTARLGLAFTLIAVVFGVTSEVLAQGSAGCPTSYMVPSKAWGVKALSDGDALVVGDGFAWPVQAGTPLHAALPDIPGDYNDLRLRGVDAVSPDDAWAVGFYPIDVGNNNRSSAPVRLHWDGSAWSIVPGPTFTNMAELYGVMALAADDVWAVGVEFHQPPQGRPVIEHWDGQSWSLVGGLETLGDLNFSWFVGGLRSISGSTGNLWAVGSSVVLHWDGVAWSVAYQEEGVQLQSVAVSSAGRVFVAGSGTKNGAVSSLVLDWDGQTWSRVINPDMGLFSVFNAVAASGPTSFWAMGTTNTYQSDRPLVVQFEDNTFRTTVDPRLAGAPGSSINAVAVALDGDIWIAGRNGLYGSEGTLRRYSAACGEFPSTITGRTFPQTHQALLGQFLSYWQDHGGLAQQGYPLSGEFGEYSDLNGQYYTVQYFERAVFELHGDATIMLSLLGRFQYDKKYPGGAPGQVANQSGQFFPQTGHWVGGEFWDYWQSHGGLEQQGYPISDEFSEVSDLDGKSYRVQYFERAVFEYHPENEPSHRVLLSQLGKYRAAEKYPTGFPPGTP